MKAGTSIHIWLSFDEFVHWSRDGTSSRFLFETKIEDIVSALSELICESFAPIFVSLCPCSEFFGDDMQMEKVVRKLHGIGTIQCRGPSDPKSADVVGVCKFHQL